jgi:APA family basic amino acid/polyamine antiporter
VFFAYIGFDAISTASEEAREPQRTIPIAILASLVACTIIYIAVAFVLTGLLKWDQYQNVADPLAKAFAERGLNWMAGFVSFGAVFATTSVLLVFQLGQPRIFFSMARDGLLPGWAAAVHPRFRTPHVTTVITGVLVAGCAAVSNINEMADLCNIGTLFAFVLVAVGILVLRRVDPNRPRPFRTPLFPWVPLAAIVSCLWLMIQLPALTWRRFVIWLVIGLVIYFLYGFRRAHRSRVESPPGTSTTGN